MKGSLLLMAAALLLSGCGTSKEQILPPGDSTMRTVWQQKTGKTPDHATRQHLQRRGITDITVSEQTMAGSYPRDAVNDIRQRFPRLPNPDMVIYVFPHLTGGEPVPVPGYSSVFPFYSRVQYALPGELPEVRRCPAC